MHQQLSSTVTMALPASPTLTNPDMILPYGEYDTTPSPPQDPMRPESTAGSWNGLIPDDMSFSIGPPGHVKMGLGPMTPTTPIIYGNGTMLSDIGEVTEAESTPARKPRQTPARLARDNDSPVRSSPTMGYNPPTRRAKPVAHHRSVSMESTSTITSEAPPADADMFKDFDDGVSVDDSNFQGDDEESVMDEGYDDYVEVAQAQVIMRKEGKFVGADDVHSSAALSRRAEMILANAKKRLDNMEGNLTRARSSLYITPSSSMSSIHSSSPLSRATPSPPEADRRIISGLGVPPAKHRQTSSSTPVSPTSPGHMRIFSENSIPSSLHSLRHSSRSPAMALPSPVHMGTESKDSAPTKYTPSPSGHFNHHVASLDPLSEDEEGPIRDRDLVRASTAEPYANPTTDHRVLTRSTSSMQMRDLTDKMKDLKGKISTLRDRAREDNMKRRSLQSLRTPSPFTAADQWFTSSTPQRSGGVGANSGIAYNAWNGEPSVSGSGDGYELEAEGLMKEQEDKEPEDPNDHPDIPEGEDVAEPLEQRAVDRGNAASYSGQDDVYDTAEEEEGAAMQNGDEGYEEGQYDDEPVDHDKRQEYQSESDASSYHDSHATPISHEDREDAFDYEHFFLHSAMGTINQERMARRGSLGSLDSFGSEDSVETTRGPGAPATLVDEDGHPIENPRGHVRSQKSTASVSTLASFVTATEGREPNGDQDDEDTYENSSESKAAPDPEQLSTTVTEKRSTFGKTTPTDPQQSDQDYSSTGGRPSSVILTTSAQPTATHQPSVSSLAPTGTARSFPLVNRSKTSNSNRASSIISEAMSLNGREVSPVDMLAREDQILIERLVASLGKCVLGLHEAGRASSEGRMWRRRMDAARKVLEEDEGAV